MITIQVIQHDYEHVKYMLKRRQKEENNQLCLGSQHGFLETDRRAESGSVNRSLTPNSCGNYPPKEGRREYSRGWETKPHGRFGDL